MHFRGDRITGAVARLSARVLPVTAILWAVAGLVGTLLDQPVGMDGHSLSIVSLSMVTMGFGGWVFIRNGGTRITAAGLYCLASSFFVGFAGLWWWYRGADTDSVHVGVLVGWWTTFAMWLLFWQTPGKHARLRLTSRAGTRWGIRTGLLTCAVGVLLASAHVGSIVQLTLGGLSLVVVAMVLHWTKGDKIVVPLILTVLVLGFFWFFTFSGAGRLNIVSTGFVAVVLISLRLKTALVKAGVVLASVPALLALALVQNGYSAGSTLDSGLGSVVNPLTYFGDLTQALGQGTFALGKGDSFVPTFLFFVPRALWPGKPAGLGSVLTGILKPGYQDSGYSLAALSQGEWFYNFGWLGLVIMVGVVGLAVRSLDKLLLRVCIVQSRRDLLVMTAVLILVAAIPTFVWVGSFTYVSRTGQQLAVLVILAAPLASRTRSLTSRRRPLVLQP